MMKMLKTVDEDKREKEKEMNEERLKKRKKVIHRIYFILWE